MLRSGLLARDHPGRRPPAQQGYSKDVGWLWLDPALAGLVAGIRCIISANADGAVEAHDLRTRPSGQVTFIDFHLVVAESMTVGAAHAICDRIETALREEVGEALVSIHVEPEGKAKLRGVVVP